MVWAVVARSPGSPLNYRHAFHAGNFADLVKHAALLRLLDELTRPGPPLTVIDTQTRAVVRQVKVGKSPLGVWTLDHAPRQ